MFQDYPIILVKILEPVSRGWNWSLIFSILAMVGSLVSFFWNKKKWQEEFKQKEKELTKKK